MPFPLNTHQLSVKMRPAPLKAICDHLTSLTRSPINTALMICLIISLIIAPA